MEFDVCASQLWEQGREQVTDELVLQQESDKFRRPIPRCTDLSQLFDDYLTTIYGLVNGYLRVV